MGLGLNFGKSSNNSSGTDNYTKSGTVTPTNPDWSTSLVQQGASGTGALAGQNPYNYVAPITQLQDQAYEGGRNLSSTPWNYDAALNLTGDVANAAAPSVKGQTASPYIDSYMNPYQTDVVNAAKGDLDYAAGQARAQFAGSDPTQFQGSRSAIGQSDLEGQLARTYADTLSGLRSQGYSQALQYANNDADRAQTAKDLDAQLMQQGQGLTLGAAGQLAGIAGQYGTEQQGNLATQANIGQGFQGAQQAYAQAPLNYQSMINQLIAGLPLQLFTGQNYSETGQEQQTGKSSGFGFGVKT